MLNILLITAKYLIILFFAVYTFLLFSSLIGKEEGKNKNFTTQRSLIFLIHFLGFFVLFSKQLKWEIIILYGVQLIFLILFFGIIYVFFEKKTSRALVNNMGMLMVTGFIILTRLSFPKAVRQFEILAVSTLVFFVVLFLYRKLIRVLPYLCWFYFGIGILLLLIVLFFAKETYGARLSINLGFFSLQPLEFVKILYVLFLTSLFNKSMEFKYLVASAVLAGIHVILLVLSRDLGSAFILFIVYLFFIYSCSGKIRYLAGGALAGGVASVIAYNLFAHVRVRVQAWLDPWPIIDNQGYQITQSLFAIGTGGWTGLGLYEGMPEKIPVVEQDFVFSAISEEMGGFFALCLILVCMGTFFAVMKIAIRQKDSFFNKTVVFGLGITYGTQLILTIGGAMKFIPSTGVTLPLISYGGSSILATMVLFGIIQANYRPEEKEEVYEEE